MNKNLIPPQLYAGAALWLVALVYHLIYPAKLNQLHVILLLAMLALAPLAFQFAAPPDDNPRARRVFGWLVKLQPFAGVLAGVAFVIKPGLLALVLCAAWALVSALAGLTGILRLLGRGWRPFEELILDGALLYLPVGGLWLVFDRLGFAPLDFSSLIVTLTAIHFHVIMLGALVSGGVLGQSLRARAGKLPMAYKLAGGGLLVGPLLVAAGITVAVVALEAVAAVVLALSLITTAVLTLRYATFTQGLKSASGLLLTLSALSISAAMLLAMAYPLGRLTGWWAISIAQMVTFHGWVNVVGFALCGLFGWRLTTA